MEPNFAEKRAAIRSRTLKGGKIVSYDLAAGGIDCVVRNLSETGACLVPENPACIPQTFELLFNDDGSRRNCRVIWRSALKLGVHFE